METTGAYTILLLLPFIFWVIGKFPLKRDNLLTHIPIHLLASMVFGASHTLLMYGSRTFIFWVSNMGTYNYGRLVYRFPMEYSHQFITYWTILAVYILIKSIRKNQEQKLMTAQLEEKLTKSRLQALQMQLNPHFFFNTLNLISSTMYDDVKAADRMLASLSDLMRITLKKTDDDNFTLENELELLNLYIEIMRARFQDKLTIKMDIDKATLKAKVPSFIMQPLVENSIKYSMETPSVAEITVQSRKEYKRMYLSVSDNGPGIAGKIEEGMRLGVGISNTVERLEKLYGSDQKFHMVNNPEGGLQVTIDIPFEIPIRKESIDERP
jgi:LytS/YehU family sensor histidine kinase